MVSSAWWFTGLVALVGVERLLELVLSKRNAAWAFERGGKEVGQGHYRVMTLFHTAFLVACVVEVHAFGRPFVPWVGWLALALVVAAQGLRYWAILTLGKRWNTRVVVLPEAAPVTGGPYRWVRHPNYVAVVVELMALPMVHGAWLTAVAFTLGNAWLLSVRIAVEEAALGELYAREFSERPRFIPGGR